MKFSELREKESRAKLFGVIRSRVDFLLDGEIREILDKIDLGKKYTVEVLEGDYEKLAEYLTEVKYRGFRHSWAGEEYDRSEVEILYGHKHIISLGSLYSYEYYLNGNKTDDEYEKVLPDFEVTGNIVVRVTKVSYSDYNNNYYNNTENYLVFYKGVSAE